MNKNWEYSEIVSKAKENGGPKKYVEIIKDEAFKEGYSKGLKVEKERNKLICIGACVGVAILCQAPKIIKYCKKKIKEKELIQVKEAEEKLVNEMEKVEI